MKLLTLNSIIAVYCLSLNLMSNGEDIVLTQCAQRIGQLGAQSLSIQEDTLKGLATKYKIGDVQKAFMDELTALQDYYNDYKNKIKNATNDTEKNENLTLLATSCKNMSAALDKFVSWTQGDLEKIEQAFSDEKPRMENETKSAYKKRKKTFMENSMQGWNVTFEGYIEKSMAK